jgi:SAM-dependent methyltransferase
MSNETYNIIHFPVTTHVYDRIINTENIITNIQPSNILDIGGVEYRSICKKNNIEYTSVNLEQAQTTGTGGYTIDNKTLCYDGRNLSFNDNSFDLVIVNFVLHHASNNTLFLLQQIKNITSKYVLIGEDLSELNYNIKWHNRNHQHQPGGIFRSDEEWRILFNLYNLKLITQYVIHRTDDINPDHIYRCLYLLEKI